MSLKKYFENAKENFKKYPLDCFGCLVAMSGLFLGLALYISGDLGIVIESWNVTAEEMLYIMFFFFTVMFAWLFIKIEKIENLLKKKKR